MLQVITGDRFLKVRIHDFRQRLDICLSTEHFDQEAANKDGVSTSLEMKLLQFTWPSMIQRAHRHAAGRVKYRNCAGALRHVVP